MNFTKKLIFGLLLAGALFTTACGSDGPKAGDACTTEADCGTDLTCDMTAKKCAEKPGGAEKLDNGKDCNAHDKCTSGFCDLAGAKKCADAPADKSVADGGTCSDAKQCSTTNATCDANKCKAPGTATPAANGEACTKDNECTSGFCDLGIGGSGTQKCKEAPAAGTVSAMGHCSKSEQCAASGSLTGLCIDASAASMGTICSYSCTQPSECSSLASGLTCGNVKKADDGTTVQGCTHS